MRYLALCLLLTGCINPVPRNEISGTIAGAPFKIRSPKNVQMNGAELTIISATAYATNFAQLKIKSYGSTNDAQVIDKSYAGQAAVTKELFNGINSSLSQLNELAKQGATKAVVP